ncbi:solute carrier family 22 member 16-like [Littorina saxatilis]|uniref:Major facilitator superfamily (MFS) profile domain-containing protein n=1 Tax=Littorina saxatilis TaxID=31220 RepID=A0AAN9AP33_9CAEN
MILEEILSDVGDNGRFQIIFTAVITIMEVVIAWSMLQTALIGATPSWWCIDPTTYGFPNMTLNNATYQTCSVAADVVTNGLVNGYVNGYSNSTDIPTTTLAAATSSMSCVRYYDPGMVTIVGEWDLVCERKYIKAVINSVQMAGVLVGSVMAGQSSDSIGRRLTCYVTMVLHALTCLVSGFATTWQMYAVFRFFVGGAIGSYLVLHYVYVIEFVRHTWRPYLASIPAWALGAGMLCLTAWQVPNWRHLNFICAGLTVPMVFGWFVSPESLRWLAARGKVEAAEKVVELIAKINGRTKATDTSEQLSLLAEEEKSHGQQDKKYTYITLVQGGWKNVMKTLVLGFAWMSLSMSFYGIIFGVSALSGNVYLNMFLLSVVEVPLTLSTAFITVRIGRRWTSSLFFFLASLTGFGILIADRAAAEETRGTIISVVAICSKLFIAAAWTCMQTFTAELYPTVIRSLGLGAANTAARVGGILAPFVLEMDTPYDAVRCYIIVGSIMAISGLSVLLLGETKGKALADTLHQEQKELNI